MLKNGLITDVKVHVFSLNRVCGFQAEKYLIKKCCNELTMVVMFDQVKNIRL